MYLQVPLWRSFVSSSFVLSTYGWWEKSEQNVQAYNTKQQQETRLRRRDGEILKAAMELQGLQNQGASDLSETTQQPHLIVTWIFAK